MEKACRALLLRKNTIWRRSYNDVARTELVPIANRAHNADRYVLMEHFPFGYGVKENFILMHENACSAISLSISGQCGGLKQPDLNPTEHLWEPWGKKLRARYRLPEPCKSFKGPFIMNGEKVTNRVYHCSKQFSVHVSVVAPKFCFPSFWGLQ